MFRVQLLRQSFVIGLSVVLLLAFLGFVPAFAQPLVVQRIKVGHGLQGPIRRAAIDRNGKAWIATAHELYAVPDGRAVSSDRTDNKDRELALAPGGGRYAWLTNGAGPNGLFRAEIVSLREQSNTASKLRPTTGPDGFSAINFGTAGNSIVTITPMDNAEGLSGEFQYAFWSDAGVQLGAILHNDPAIPILDEQGAGLLLLGAVDASAYSREGARLWKIDGRFRKGGLASSGSVAVLNPAREIDELRIVGPGVETKVKLPGAVYEVALTPSGRKAAVATSGGVLSLLDIRSCLHGACVPKRLPPLIPDGNFNISSVRFIDESVLAVAVIEREGAPPNLTYPKGDVFVVNVDGGTLFHFAMDIPQPAMRSPSLDVVFGSAHFAAFTRDEAVFVRIR
jgi:hypothetical protein